MAFSFFYEAFDAFTQLKDGRAMSALKYMILMRILGGKVEFRKSGLFPSYSISILFLFMFARSIKPFVSRLCGIRTYYGKIIPDHKLKYEFIFLVQIKKPAKPLKN